MAVSAYSCTLQCIPAIKADNITTSWHSLSVIPSSVVFVSSRDKSAQPEGTALVAN